MGSIGFELFLNLTYDKFAMYVYKNARNTCVGQLLLGGEPPQFRVVERALTLTYDQALVWVGTYFCPMMPLLGVLRSVVMFYSEKRSTLKHTEPRSIVIASKFGLSWLIWALMLATFTLAVLPLLFVLTQVSPSGPSMGTEWHNAFVDTITSTTVCGAGVNVVDDCRVCLVPNSSPETVNVCWQGDRYADLNGGGGVQLTLAEFCDACPRGCGPFRTLTAPWDVLTHESRTWPSWLADVLYFTGTPTFTAVLSAIFLCLFLVSQAKSKGRLRWGLHQQRLRDSEFWDKRWILEGMSKKLGSTKHD